MLCGVCTPSAAGPSVHTFITVIVTVARSQTAVGYEVSHTSYS